MEDGVGEISQTFTADSDICKQLLTRYSHSSAGQHRHLCAAAAATRSIIESSSLPLTPISYFAATITSVSSTEALDSTALAALTTFLSIVLPLVSKGEINQKKAENAVQVLVVLVKQSAVNLGTSSVKAVVKCLSVLVAEFCDLNNWESVALGFKVLLKFCIDKRPKVRKCAQDCFLSLFKSFESSAVRKKAVKSIFLLLKEHMQAAAEIARSETVDGYADDAIPKTELQDVIHVLNTIKHLIPHFNAKTLRRTLALFLKVLSKSSEVAMHIFNAISVVFETSGDEEVVSNADEIFKSLMPYTSLGEKDTFKTALSAASLAKTAICKLHDSDADVSTKYLPQVTESLAGLMSHEAEVSLQASNIFRELIEHIINQRTLSTIKSQEIEKISIQSMEFSASKIICSSLYNALNNLHHIPDEHFLSIVALLFLKLDRVSSILMEGIVLKLSDLLNSTSSNASEIKCIQDCIGSAVASMGPEKVLSLLPITVNAKDFSCSNCWLIPVLNKNVFGSSLRYFIEHIIPLANSFEQASKKVAKSVIGQDLQAYAHDMWRLLPAFCRYPTDTCQSFNDLAKLLVLLLKKDSFMLESITISLEELVKHNQLALASDQGSVVLTKARNSGISNEDAIDLKTRKLYSRKVAKRNLVTLASCSRELLHVLINILIGSPPEIRKPIKGAIRSLVSVGDSSVMKQIFITALKKFQHLGNICDNGEVEDDTKGSVDEEDIDTTSVGMDAERYLILDLAYCFVDISEKDLINLLFQVIKDSLQGSSICHIEAYQMLSLILEKHSWLCTSQFDMVMDLLSGVKSSACVLLLESRCTCLQTLLVYMIMRNLDEDNTKTFLILNEIILMLKDSNEEGRKAACNAISGIGSKLRTSDATSDEPYHKLVTMILGYVSGSSPRIKSGVVSLLSVLVYNDPDICLTEPDILHSVLELLHSKAIEVIKAVLGFVKVFVSSLKPNDLQKSLPDVLDGVLRWSSVTRHHFKTKVTVILEIMMRKCGVASVKGLTPEKYKDYVQEVVTNRRGKASSKETATGEMKPELADLSPKGQLKRKREKSAMPTGEGSNRRWKRKGDDKQNLSKPFKRNGHSGGKGKMIKRHGGQNFKREKGIKKHQTVFFRQNPVV